MHISAVYGIDKDTNVNTSGTIVDAEESKPRLDVVWSILMASSLLRK